MSLKVLFAGVCVLGCRGDLQDTHAPGDSVPAETGGTPDETGDTAAGEPTSVKGIPVAVVSDGANQRVRYIRLDTAEVAYEIELSTLHPTQCGSESVECVLYGIEPSIDPETDEDLLLLTFNRVEPSDDSGYEINALGSTVTMARITSAGPIVDWSFSDLDFTVNYSGEDDFCTAKEACALPEYGDERRNCWLQGVHDVEILEETDASVSLLITDTGSRSRLLMVTLDKNPGNTCAVVDEVIGDGATDGWNLFENTNDADRVEYNGEEMLLVNHKAAAGMSGRGKTTLWASKNDQWHLLSEHPPHDERRASFLNAPHNSDLVRVDEEHFVVFAHSNGNGGNFENQGFDETDHFGTIGVLRVEGENLSYLFDGVITKGESLKFVRDVDLLPDGTWLVTDSGCNYHLADCSHEATIRHISMPLAGEAAKVDGRWSAGQEFMALREVEELSTMFESPLSCDLSIPYESDYRTGEEFGSVIRDAIREPLASCQ